MEESPELFVAVVVPTYKRPDLLDRCLAALVVQSLSSARYEVLVADDGPDEATLSVVERWRARAPMHRFRYIPVRATQGPAAARNRAWIAARAPVIAFTDDDTIPAPQWLASGLQAMEPGVAAVSGKVDVPVPRFPTDYERDVEGLARAEFVTANCFVRRDWLERVGGFDERFQIAWREDSDLQFALLARGARVVSAPQAVVTHPVRPARWGTSIAQQRKVVFDALLYKKYPREYRNRIHRSPPWNYYVIVAALIVAAVAVAARRPGAAWISLAVWGALTAEFCVRRLRGCSKDPLHVLEMIWTSMVIPPASMFWRIRGALRFRVLFL